jgi:hypothetical protein
MEGPATRCACSKIGTGITGAIAAGGTAVAIAGAIFSVDQKIWKVALIATLGLLGLVAGFVGGAALACSFPEQEQ